MLQIEFENVLPRTYTFFSIHNNVFFYSGGHIFLVKFIFRRIYIGSSFFEEWCYLVSKCKVLKSCTFIFQDGPIFYQSWIPYTIIIIIIYIIDIHFLNFSTPRDDTFAFYLSSINKLLSNYNIRSNFRSLQSYNFWTKNFHPKPHTIKNSQTI